MIVRSLSDGLLLITQPEHARLAGQIIQHCAALRAHPRRLSILRAVGEHDNGWADVDAEPTVIRESGQVSDFVNAPLDVRQGVWFRGISRLASEPWTAALVAQHALTAYERFRSDSLWASFFTELETTRDSLLRANSSTCLGDLLNDYVFVRLGDLMSLAFCAGGTATQGYAGWSIRIANNRVIVAPDPFGGATIPVEVETRQICRKRFRTDSELRTALRTATLTKLRGEVAGVGASSWEPNRA